MHSSDAKSLQEYLGACHGYVGIVQVLTMVKDALGDDDEHFSHHTTVQAFHETLAHLADSLFTNALSPSGNLPSSLPLSRGRDRLVQWCHGVSEHLTTNFMPLGGLSVYSYQT